MNDVNTIIRLVVSTLNDVEVKGKDNLDKLLGSINALETVVQLLEAPPAPPAPESNPPQPEEKKEEVNG